MGQTSNPTMMSTSQIIAILKQAPDMIATLKDIAGQQFGVDPSAISDDGIYNCIQQDSNFRSQAVQELINQGYVANPPQPLSRGETRQPLPARRVPRVQTPQTEQPSEVRRLTPVPYPNLLSLRDLYSQEVRLTGTLKRFGSDAFLFGMGNANLLPMDLPVGPDYVLGPGDDLILNMWGGQSLRLSRTVDRQGEIALPEAGTIIVSGLTIAQAQEAIQKALGTQFQNEHVESPWAGSERCRSM